MCADCGGRPIALALEKTSSKPPLKTSRPGIDGLVLSGNDTIGDRIT